MAKKKGTNPKAKQKRSRRTRRPVKEEMEIKGILLKTMGYDWESNLKTSLM